MERVFLKLESEGLMTNSNTAVKNTAIKNINTAIKNVAVNKLNDFEQIKSLIDEAILTEDKGNSVRATFLFKCAMVSLNPKYKIHKCAIVKRAITRKELNLWVASVYECGLREAYNLTMKKFKEDMPRHYQALVDISEGVQVYIGNFHNANRDFNSIPLCKVWNRDGLNHLISAINTDAEKFSENSEGVFLKDNKIYMNLEFLKNLDNIVEYPIKDRVMTKENGFSEDVIESIANGAKFKLFSINQIMRMASPIINYSEFKKKEGKTEQEQIEDNEDFASDLMNKITNKNKKEFTTVLNSLSQGKFFNRVKVWIDQSVFINDYKNIISFLEFVQEAVNKNVALKKYLNENNFIHYSEQHTKNSNYYNSIVKAINNK